MEERPQGQLAVPRATEVKASHLPCSHLPDHSRAGLRHSPRAMRSKPSQKCRAGRGLLGAPSRCLGFVLCTKEAVCTPGQAPVLLAPDSKCPLMSWEVQLGPGCERARRSFQLASSLLLSLAPGRN